MCEEQLKARWISPFFILFALLLLIGINTKPVSANVWQIETVDSAGYVGDFPSLAIDATTGNPRISYYDNINDDLKYAEYDGSAWQIEAVDTAGSVGYQSSLALDPTTGYPCISYMDAANLDLKYAAYSGSEWQIETIDTSGFVGYSSSLALDPDTGNPRISYYDNTNGVLKYAAYNGSSWEIETVDSIGSVGEFNSLVLDPTTGYPQISYFDRTNDDLKYAAYNGSSWQIETVDFVGDTGYFTSLALDPATGYPRISYHNNTNDDLKYAAYNGSSWQIETVDFVGDTGYFTSLALDPTTGYPRISYFDNSNSDLKYTAYYGLTWQVEVVDATGIVGWYSSLALDPTTGYPRISYQDITNGDLKYASLLTINFAPSITSITVPTNPITLNTAISVNGTFTDQDLGDTHTAVWDWGDSTTSVGIVTDEGGSGIVNGSHTYTTPGNYTVTLTVTDTVGESNTVAAETDIVVLPTDPSIISITVPVDPVPVNAAITVDGSFTDPEKADTHTAVWDWGDGNTSEGTVTEVGGSGTVNGLHTYTIPGIYTVILTVNDSFGGSDTETAETYIVIYDPAGGFATGNGWFDSPSGAYRDDTSLTGMANFGFVSKYNKGATIPEGNTQFKFKVADLRFESTNYKWLVVNKAGMNAQFSGQGTINDDLAPNNEEYKFMIWATDGTPDTFRIKIWWEGNSIENIVYDNDVQQPIDGGAIQVHAK